MAETNSSVNCGADEGCGGGAKMENVTFQHRKRAPTLGSAVVASRHFNMFFFGNVVQKDLTPFPRRTISMKRFSAAAGSLEKICTSIFESSTFNSFQPDHECVQFDLGSWISPVHE